MNEPAIRIAAVTKSFGANFAVQAITLDIQEGEFFSLLGPSGCGKTTLLRMIAGFETPTTGKILIAGEDMHNVPPHKRKANMVFQNYALFPHLTVFNNVAFGLKSSHTPRGEIQERVKTALDLVRLGDFAERMPAQLSGGQQQRVALARAVVNRPKVLLLDEPLSALDIQIREEMQNELARLQRQLNMTFVMVTHDQHEALALSTRVAVFCKGNLEQVGTPHEIFEQPNTRFVASFIGQSNLIHGTLKNREGNFAVVEIENGINVIVRDNPKCATVQNGQPVIAWIKPHSLYLNREEAIRDSTAEVSEMTLSSVEVEVIGRSYQGSSVEYLCRLSQLNHVQIRLSLPGKEQRELTIGQKVTLHVAGESCSFLACDPFDASTAVNAQVQEHAVETALSSSGINASGGGST